MLASRNGKAGNDGSDSGTAQICGYRDIMKAKRFSNTLLKTTLSPMCIDQHILNWRSVSTGEERGTLSKRQSINFIVCNLRLMQSLSMSKQYKRLENFLSPPLGHRKPRTKKTVGPRIKVSRYMWSKILTSQHFKDKVLVLF